MSLKNLWQVRNKYASVRKVDSKPCASCPSFLRRLLNKINNLIKIAMDELNQIQLEDLFLHHWRDKK